MGGQVGGVEGAGFEENFPVEIGEAEVVEARGKKFADALRVGGRQSGERLKNGLVRRVRESIAGEAANGERATFRREAILTQRGEQELFHSLAGIWSRCGHLRHRRSYRGRDGNSNAESAAIGKAEGRRQKAEGRRQKAETRGLTGGEVGIKIEGFNTKGTKEARRPRRMNCRPAKTTAGEL